MLDRRTAQEVRMHSNQTKSQSLIYVDKQQPCVMWLSENKHTSAMHLHALTSELISARQLHEYHAKLEIAVFLSPML